jgi:hypothetical protein
MVFPSGGYELRLRSSINGSSMISSSPANGAIDVLGCDIDIDMMTTVLISMPSIIKNV